MRRRTPAALCAAASFVVIGLLAAKAPAELRIGAASSLREPLGAIAALFAGEPGGASAEIAFGASSVLAVQIRAGAPIDLLLAADARIAEQLAGEGLTEPPVPFASNRLVVVASRDLPPVIHGPGDLARPEVRRIAIPEHAVPVGRYARDWLRRHGLETALAPRVVRTEHARATLSAVAQGHAELAIVYASDARLARSARVVLEIPAAEQPTIAYAGAVVRGSREAPAARAFLRFLADPRAVARLSQAGLHPPPQALQTGPHPPPQALQTGPHPPPPDPP
jgi:molybdate transport system substrate-binding protein